MTGSVDQVKSRRGVAVILVNWRTPDMTLRAVESVFLQSRPPEHVFVVDNGSGDGSVEVLREALGLMLERTTLVVNSDNRGFGGGCNPAITAALAAGYRYVWLLNSDAVPESTCLAALVRTAQAADQPLGAVGSLLVDTTGLHKPHYGSWMRPGALTCGNVEQPDDLNHGFAWCTAASLLLDCTAISVVGGFDEGFFMYWEDADLNMRLRNAGFALLCAPDARVTHDAGTSSADIPVQRYLWHFDSQRRFLTKHHKLPAIARTLLRCKFLLKALYDRDTSRFRAILVRR